MSDANSPAHLLALETKVLVVTIKYAKSTRWLLPDNTFVKGLTRQVELMANMDTEGPLPIVTVTEGKP